jgi:hypothetical protein
VNIDTAQRALDRAQRRLDRDPGSRSARQEVDRCRDQLARVEAKTADKLERQGYEVSRRR